jgi:hypothetical protein
MVSYADQSCIFAELKQVLALQKCFLLRNCSETEVSEQLYSVNSSSMKREVFSSLS